MDYKTYNNSKRKLRTLWEENEKQESQIDNLKPIKLDFNSINFKKNIYTYETVIETQPSSGYASSIEFDNFPDWIMPYVNIVLVAGEKNKIPMSTYVINNSYSIEVRKLWENNNVLDEDGNVTKYYQRLLFYFKFNRTVVTDVKLLIEIVNPRNYHEVRKSKT